jgi:hypothetical protein
MTRQWQTIWHWGLLGALSGAIATVVIYIPLWLGINETLELSLNAGGFDITISPMSLVPGLVFGLIVGHALRREGLAHGAGYAIYIAAAGLSYFLAVQLTLNVLVDLLQNIILIGVAAGAFGAALLAAATAALIPDFRRRKPMIAMVLAGAVLGAALFFAISNDHFLGWLLLFAPWQAGYATAMATALED